jgi:hypothetical protein
MAENTWVLKRDNGEVIEGLTEDAAIRLKALYDKQDAEEQAKIDSTVNEEKAATEYKDLTNKLTKSIPLMIGARDTANIDNWSKGASDQAIKNQAEGEVLNEMYGNREGLALSYPTLGAKKTELGERTLKHLADLDKMDAELQKLNKRDKPGGNSDFERRYLKVEEMDKSMNLGLSPQQKYVMATNYGLSDLGIDASAERSAKQAAATSPIQTQTAVATEVAKGAAFAGTPDFISAQKKDWETQIKDFSETIKNYQFAKNSQGQGAVGDVALIKALEKIREPQSAVMYGDYQTWQKAKTAYGKVIDSGLWDASAGMIKGELDPATRSQLYQLLDKSYAVASNGFKKKRNSQIEAAVEDYEWPVDRATRIYRDATIIDQDNDGAQSKGPKKWNAQTKRWE